MVVQNYPMGFDFSYYTKIIPLLNILLLNQSIKKPEFFTIEDVIFNSD